MKNLKLNLLAIAALSALGTSAWGRFLSSIFTPANSVVKGDYVEARTASVFCGACHYNGELVTTGRDALMAWNFTSGVQDGVSLAGVRAVAAIRSDENLANTSAPHKAEIVVDSQATTEQVNAVVSLLKLKCGAALGTIVEVRRAPITFTHSDKGYSVDVADFGSLRVQHLPDDSCCVQAADVWYSPLSPILGRKVGYTETASFTGIPTAPWYRSAENSAFYGSFSF